MNTPEAKHSLVKAALAKVKMTNAGKKMKNMVVSASKPSNISYPHLYLNAEQLPDLSHYEVGDEVDIMLKGVIDSHSLDDGKHGKRESFDICVRQLACLNHPKLKK